MWNVREVIASLLFLKCTELGLVDIDSGVTIHWFSCFIRHNPTHYHYIYYCVISVVCVDFLMPVVDTSFCSSSCMGLV